MGFWVKLKAILVRILFAVHICVSVYRLVVEREHWGYSMIAVGAVLALLLEGIFTLGCSKHGEWRRFIPCVFIYLAGTVPTLCLLEWSLLENRLIFQEKVGTNSCSLFENNDTIGRVSIAFRGIDFEESFDLGNINWALFLEQAMVFLLVVGRWLLPKGKISRETLSNVLLAYIGTAADIIEFLAEGVQTELVSCEKMVVLIMLIIWSVSLFMFPLELSPKPDPRRKSLSQTNETLMQRCGNTEVWAIILVVIMQDGPFLGMRLYLIIIYEVFDQGLIFFTFKNILVIMLQLYRLWILLCLTWDQEEGQFSFRITAAIRQSLRAPPRDRHSADHGPHQGADNSVFQFDNEMAHPDGTQLQTPYEPPQSPNRRHQSPQFQGQPQSPHFQEAHSPQFQGQLQYSADGQPIDYNRSLPLQRGYNNNYPPQQTTDVPHTVDGRGRKKQPKQKHRGGGEYFGRR